MDTTHELKILEINSSARGGDSVSSKLSADLIAALVDHHSKTSVARRDLSAGVPFLDEAWVAANFTPDEDRTESQRQTLAHSDSLIAELKDADVLVIGAPLYNFSIPATLKAWIDQIARARVTFRYTENGPEGLLTGKKAYIVVATGGVPVGSPMDFATPYLRHALGFVGITDIEIIAADRMNSDADSAMDRARSRIAELVYLTSRAA